MKMCSGAVLAVASTGAFLEARPGLVTHGPVGLWGNAILGAKVGPTPG